MTTPVLEADHRRYADVRDRALAAALAEEDAAEELGLSALERVSCRLHRRWLHHCVHSADHVIKVTGHRWCRDCFSPASVGVDELTGDVLVRCESCRRTPDTAATRQIVRACRASLAASRGFFPGNGFEPVQAAHRRGDRRRARA
ncbi:hypothetical protein [Lentzea albida]|uniref:Uncharacterized protein n=1 Tax=Lentzea albida TaxID=65499 RepID=A0A1H9RFG2_9PSEU|nr:hypothetical protein [Lentzea albida]SER71496.1 hypothetical protein SAMN04488000_11186 [Lentzea albida]